MLNHPAEDFGMIFFIKIIGLQLIYYAFCNTVLPTITIFLIEFNQ